MVESRAKQYPSGYVLASPEDTETTPTLTDLLSTFEVGGDEEKYISIANLLANIIGFVAPPTVYTASGAIASNVTFASITSATPATAVAMTIAAPAAGRLLVISQLDAGTVGNTVTLSAGAYETGKTTATFNAKDETLVLFGISATRFVVVENIGSVALST
jgi:hypothetical protein